MPETFCLITTAYLQRYGDVEEDVAIRVGRGGNWDVEEREDKEVDVKLLNPTPLLREAVVLRVVSPPFLQGKHESLLYALTTLA